MYVRKVDHDCTHNDLKSKESVRQPKYIKFMFFQKATKIDEIFTADLTLSSTKCQINGEDFINFCGLLINHELYLLCAY